MIIYIIMKFLMSYVLVFKWRLIRDHEKLSMVMDSAVICLFIWLLSKNSNLIVLSISVLKFTIIIIGLFLIYRLINYLVWIDLPIVTNEKIRKFFLKPIVCNIVYYTIWLLPWNIGYWIYFYILEHGWYIRVWVSSTRDIVLWRLFKWDSRDFFYKLNEKMRIKSIIRIKDEITKIMWRIQYMIYIIRGSIQKVKISKYIYMRIVIYMYLTIFYVYGLVQIIMINKVLFIMLIIIELIVLYKLKEIIEYYDHIINVIIWNRLIFTLEQTLEINKIRGGLKDPFLSSTRKKNSMNYFHWDRILNNSLSLTILYKYMYYVEKNTRGYFNKKMNIQIVINEFKEDKEGESGLIWSVLPRTRYVIMSLKNLAYSEKALFVTRDGKNPYKDIDPHIYAREKVNLVRNRNFYLSYYEKTYNNTSLLMLVWNLRNNLTYWFYHQFSLYMTNQNFYNKGAIYHLFYINFPIEFMFLFLTYIYVNDKRLISDVNMILEFFLDIEKKYYLEELYFINYEGVLKEKRNELKIPEKICSLKQYKKMFKIMSKITLFREVGIVWNEELQKRIAKFEVVKWKDENIKKKIIDFFLLLNKGFDSNFDTDDGWMNIKIHLFNFGLEKEALNNKDWIYYNGERVLIPEEVESYKQIISKLELSPDLEKEINLNLIIVILILFQIELSYCFTTSLEELRLNGDYNERVRKYIDEINEYFIYFDD